MTYYNQIVETNDREKKSYKWSQNKRHTMHWGEQVRVATNFSFDENKNQKKKKTTPKLNSIFKVLKEQNC